MFKKLLPRSGGFFEFFKQHSQLAIEACIELDSLAAAPGELEKRAERIKAIEHEADKIARRCIDALHSTFITPIDRSDIHRLIRRLDDIIDEVDSVSASMTVYRMTEVKPEMQPLTKALVEATESIGSAIEDLPVLSKKGAEIQRHCEEVYEAESRADGFLRSALVRLFDEEKDPIVVIKWKEVFEGLERATDCCQVAAHVISGIVIEAS